jgi:hypothetical protein
VRPESWLADLSAKDRQLVSEHKDLQLLRSVTSPEEHRQLQQAADDDVRVDTSKGDLQLRGRRRYCHLSSLRATPDRVSAPHARSIRIDPIPVFPRGEFR